MQRYLKFSLLTLFIALSACTNGNLTENSSIETAAEPENIDSAFTQGAEPEDVEPTVEGVGRIESESEPTPVAAAPSEVLQTQPGPRGMEVDLRRAVVTGDILTVEITYRNPTDRVQSTVYKPDKVSIIDDATSKRYDVLQDDTERYMASPLAATDSISLTAASKGGAATGWFKFPAPPPSSETISVNIPEVGAFLGVPVQR
ncbi:hypothetical protein C1752_09730 [Acaryochloris thomasi RCC1774]|uniref:DUF4352 domain-containing protein n=1 Tax=Acaryochloris thomasi RCC1774 TaxID=1764569 RepID=A0A2W1J9K4_9CYAN|nr:hypothetical protein [Acaryochloris thomasi]PZD70738.1 hypothetical protein C1752_09730 [Acaryochloris thomasi RCC1774]